VNNVRDLPSESEMLARFREPGGRIVMARLIQAFLPRRERAFHALARLILAGEEYDRAMDEVPLWRRQGRRGNALAGQLARRLPRYHLRCARRAARALAGPRFVAQATDRAPLWARWLGERMLSVIAWFMEGFSRPRPEDGSGPYDPRRKNQKGTLIRRGRGI
jgi:hypothetical protein